MKYFIYATLIVLCIACNGPEPRQPVKRNTTSAIEQAINRSKKLLAAEEFMIKAFIAKDSMTNYQQSSTGSWYYYDKKNNLAKDKVQPGDLVTMTYNLVNLTNDTLYNMQDIGIITYKVDKQELLPGLRNAVKLLKENETATFLFPSSMGYGVPGDGDKIGINTPLKSTIAILGVEKANDSL